MTQELLEARRELKERKPVFIRQDNPKRMKLNDKWRKPKGIHSKIKHKFKGRRKMPSPGYKSPKKVKGLHSSGLKITNISSANGLAKIEKATEGVVISKSTGMKKRIEILKKSKELGINILNLNADEHIKKIEDFVNSKKKKDGKYTKKEEDKKKEKTEAKMGFHESVVPQVMGGKTKTYRLRDHGLKVGDSVVFENSQSMQKFGHAKISGVEKTKVGNINLNDANHYKTYDKVEELIEAFKQHHPEKDVTPETDAWIYSYEFSHEKPEKPQELSGEQKKEEEKKEKDKVLTRKV